MPWWLPWAHVEALMRRPLTVPQPNGRQPLVIREVDGFQGGFCATMEVTHLCSMVSIRCNAFHPAQLTCRHYHQQQDMVAMCQRYLQLSLLSVRAPTAPAVACVRTW